MDPYYLIHPHYTQPGLFFFTVLLTYKEYPLLRFCHPRKGPEMEVALFKRQKQKGIVILISTLQRHQEQQIKTDKGKQKSKQN